MSTVNVSMSDLLTQLRKLDSEMAFTTQFPQVLDYQLLLQVDLFIRCQSHYGGRMIEMQVYDYWGQWSGNDYRKPWPPPPGEYDWVRTYGNCQLVWPLYNTKERQFSVRDKRRERRLMGEGWQLEEDLEETQERQEAEAARISEPSPVLQGRPQSIDEYLERLPDSFSMRQLFAAAKEMDPNIKHWRDLQKYLEDRDYKVIKSINNWVAYRNGKNGKK
jgi:hypothetical protein